MPPPVDPPSSILHPRLRSPRSRRPARTPWAVVAFLAAFAAGLGLLSHFYLLPALRTFLTARQQGDKTGTAAITATSALLLAVILVILVAGILLTFRIGRFFFPRKTEPRTRTKYVDAWAESGKRMEVPPADEP
jgi:hypothetical protein